MRDLTLPARHLYERLDFRELGRDGVYVPMAWRNADEDAKKLSKLTAAAKLLVASPIG